MICLKIKWSEQRFMVRALHYEKALSKSFKSVWLILIGVTQLMKVLALINTNLVSEEDVTMLPDVSIAGTPIHCGLIELERPSFN